MAAPSAPGVEMLVLLPGLGGTGELFAPLVLEIQGRLDTQIISYPLDRHLTYVQLAHYVRERLPQGRRFAILAESFSGPVALSIAAAPPDGLSALILSCTFGRFPDGLLRRLGYLLPYLPLTRPPSALLAPLLMGRWRTAAMTKALDGALAHVETGVLRARALAALGADMLADVPAITIPTLYLAAQHDRIIPRAALAELRALNPRFQSAELAGPHFLLQCNPACAWAEISRFLCSNTQPHRRSSYTPLLPGG
jgi:pimeloyl-ACP methyl ester carboxylesterase